MTTTALIPVQWSTPIKVDVKHVNLSDTLGSIMHGIAQAARGEGKQVDTKHLPTDDDE